MKKCFLLIAVACVTAVWADTNTVDVSAVPQKKVSSKKAAEVRNRYLMRKLGGFIVDRRRQKGKVVIVNGQKSADEQWLKDAADVFSKDVFIDVEVTSGTFDLFKPDVKGQATVFVVDDDKLPMSLVASEAHWSMFNVAFLKSKDVAFFKARVMKSTTRAIVPLLGGADSQYPLCVMGIVSKAEDLDRFIDSRLPVDVIERMKRNMSAIGVAPYSISNYRNACREGWASAPTNEYQKAIWDEVHALPTKPIKIEYDKNRDK